MRHAEHAGPLTRFSSSLEAEFAEEVANTQAFSRGARYGYGSSGSGHLSLNASIVVHSERVTPQAR